MRSTFSASIASGQAGVVTDPTAPRRSAMNAGSPETTPSTGCPPPDSHIRFMNPAAVGKSGEYVVSQKYRSMPVHPQAFFTSAGPETRGTGGIVDVGSRCDN